MKPHKVSKRVSTRLLFGSLLVFPVFLLAATPVKSVDQSGKVTYSDKPVPGAKTVSKVPISEGPSSAEINAAQQQAKETIKAADKVDAANKAESENRKSEKKSSEKSSITEQKVINSGGGRKPVDKFPVQLPVQPKPPINRPGINPPPSTQPVPKSRPAARN